MRCCRPIARISHRMWRRFVSLRNNNRTMAEGAEGGNRTPQPLLASQDSNVFYHLAPNGPRARLQTLRRRAPAPITELVILTFSSISTSVLMKATPKPKSTMTAVAIKSQQLTLLIDVILNKVFLKCNRKIDERLTRLLRFWGQISSLIQQLGYSSLSIVVRC